MKTDKISLEEAIITRLGERIEDVVGYSLHEQELEIAASYFLTILARGLVDGIPECAIKQVIEDSVE